MHDFKVGTVYKYKDEKIEKKLVFIGYMEVESFVTEPLGIDEILGYYGGMIVETKEEMRKRFMKWMLISAGFMRVEHLEQPFETNLINIFSLDALQKYFFETKEQRNVKAWLVKSQMVNKDVPSFCNEIEIQPILDVLCDYYMQMFDNLGREKLIDKLIQTNFYVGTNEECKTTFRPVYERESHSFYRYSVKDEMFYPVYKCKNSSKAEMIRGYSYCLYHNTIKDKTKGKRKLQNILIG